MYRQSEGKCDAVSPDIHSFAEYMRCLNINSHVPTSSESFLFYNSIFFIHKITPFFHLIQNK